MQWEDEYGGYLVTVQIDGDQRSGFTASYIASDPPLRPTGRDALTASLPERFPTEAEALATAYEQARNAIDQGVPR